MFPPPIVSLKPFAPPLLMFGCNLPFLVRSLTGEIAYSAEVETALDRLLYAIDHPPFIIDEEHYIALSQLPLTYPWPSITIDLRPYIPFFERHLVAHLLSGRCGLLQVDVPAHTILDAWLKLLSEAIVHGISMCIMLHTLHHHSRAYSLILASGMPQSCLHTSGVSIGRCRYHR